MTVQLLAFPFRRNGKGEVVTEDDTSIQYCAERLQVIIATQPGERLMVPDFGIRDPAFDGFTEQALRIQVSRFGLPVDIYAVTTTTINDGQQKVNVQFDMAATIYTTREQ